MPKRLSPRSQTRFAGHEPRGARVILPETHHAHANGTTMFPDRVFHASLLKRVLKSGHNSKKTGKIVEKGDWMGMQIYTLTLEERRTCSSSCLTWDRCYGNNMHYAERIIADSVFQDRLWRELQELDAQDTPGFVVRLHVLGDFFSVEYVNLWARALVTFDGLRIWGYTGREPDSPIGLAILELNKHFADRVRIRFSGFEVGGLGALVIPDASHSRHVICPAELKATTCCGTCAFCWTSDKTIEFLEH